MSQFIITPWEKMLFSRELFIIYNHKYLKFHVKTSKGLNSFRLSYSSYCGWGDHLLTAFDDALPWKAT